MDVTHTLKALAAAAAALALPGVVLAQAAPDTATPVAIDSILPGATAVLRVDGMSCPFCAHGLEKRLREIAALDTLVIRVSDGLVYVRAAAGASVTDDEFRAAVKKAGFTLRDIQRPGS